MQRREALSHVCKLVGSGALASWGASASAQSAALSDTRITQDGVIVIKAQGSRSLEQNKADALARLQALVDSVALPPRERKPTRPTRASQQRRLQGKAQRSATKQGRSRVQD